MNIMSIPKLVLGLSLSMIAFAAHAGDPGLSFYHKDWELTCDNTRTCRAAGYSTDVSDMPVSLLLTRQAGPRTLVSVEVMLGSYGDESVANELPNHSNKLMMRINGRNVGAVQFDKGALVAKLSVKQIDALLAALPRKAELEWKFGEHIWRVSDQGAAAALLKMDEFQGRLGTPGALVKKGAIDEENVLPPLPVPVVLAAAVPKEVAIPMTPKQIIALRKALKATLKKEDYCQDLDEVITDERSISLVRLNDSKLLASSLCWRGAYNSGYGYWVINDKPPYAPLLVTTSGSDYSEGSIDAAHKGRGLGDCWSNDTWTWDGVQFVHTASSSTGMCRLIAAGGAWQLPRIVTEVRAAKP